MHVFHIRGFSGLMVLLLAAMTTLAIVVMLPAMFLMIAWNAIIYETLHGPLIGLDQGLLLWGIVIVLLKLIYQPTFELQFQRMEPFRNKPDTRSALPEARSEEEPSPPVLDEKPAE